MVKSAWKVRESSRCSQKDSREEQEASTIYWNSEKAANVDLKEEKRLKRFTYIDLFRFRNYAKRTVILIMLW